MKLSNQNANMKTTKLTFWGLAWLVVAILFITGCSAALNPGGKATPTSVSAVQIPETSQSYIQMSKTALSQQLNISQDQIDLQSITEPASTDGIYIVKLKAKGQTYEYQGGDESVKLISKQLSTDFSADTNSSPMVTFDLNDSIAAASTSDIVPAVEQSDQTPYWAVTPKHLEISFSDYSQPDSILMPKIYAYPVTALKVTNQMAADQVNNLQELLLKKADIRSIQSLPLLPLFNAQSMFNTRGQYLEFSNGSGIRYLTQLGQSAEPINNHGLFYTFQGLTDNGAYYVAAIFPLAQENLPADIASADNSFANGFENYIQGMQDELATAGSNSFTPNVDYLDNLVSSISIQ